MEYLLSLYQPESTKCCPKHDCVCCNISVTVTVFSTCKNLDTDYVLSSCAWVLISARCLLFYLLCLHTQVSANFLVHKLNALRVCVCVWIGLEIKHWYYRVTQYTVLNPISKLSWQQVVKAKTFVSKVLTRRPLFSASVLLTGVIIDFYRKRSQGRIKWTNQNAALSSLLVNKHRKKSAAVVTFQQVRFAAR